MENLNTSAISYTNRDFSDIYPELLNMAKDLAYMWNPTVSNESDPGVVLIKQMALMADRVNYMADKNALENFPLSATQMKSARALYELLGFSPRWYQASECDIVLQYHGESIEEYKSNPVLIPAFTKFDDGKSITFTTTQDVSLNLWTKDAETVRAIQGIAKQLRINGDTNIRISNLDSQNRVILPDYNIAQNGIFIRLTEDSNNIGYFERVDNIYLHPSGSYIYKFGIDSITGECYVQFPDDISQLIGDGLNITYIITDGDQGNTSIQTITNITDSSIEAVFTRTLTTGESSITLTLDNMYVSNVSSYLRGLNPETIDEMYFTWKKKAGTFDTLVTLRDYTNAIRLLDQVSNGFVCDRTNDVQTSYRISSETNSSITEIPMQEQGHELSAFDLKVFALKTCPVDITKYSVYDSTFAIYSDLDPSDLGSPLNMVVSQLESLRCINHDYQPIIKDKVAYIKLKYPVELHITTSTKLSQLQQQSVKQNICNAVYDKFNASKVDFGEGIDYDTFVRIIKQSDSRISSLYMQAISYDAFVVYFDYDLNRWTEVCITPNCKSYNYGYFANNRFYTDSTLTQVMSTSIGNYYCDNITKNVYMYLGTKFELISDKMKMFQVEVITKNVLAGITPLFVKDERDFEYSLSQDSFGVTSQTGFIEGAKSLLCETSYEMDFTPTSLQQSITVKDSDSIVFTSPAVITTDEYGAYINYLYYGVSQPSMNEDFQIPAGEYLLVFYKESDSDYRYRITKYFSGTIIRPNFVMQTSTIDNLGVNLPQVTDSENNSASTYFVLNDNTTYFTNRSNDSIQILKQDGIIFNTSDKYIYFISSKKINNDDVDYYELKVDGRRVLSDNEFLLVTDSKKRNLQIFGSGSVIECGNYFESRFIAKDRDEILQQGINYIVPYMQNIVSSDSLSVYSTNKITASPSDVINFTLLQTPSQNTKFTINADGIFTDTSFYSQNIKVDSRLTVDNTQFNSVNISDNIKSHIRYLFGDIFGSAFSGTIKYETAMIPNTGLITNQCVYPSGEPRVGELVTDLSEWNRLRDSGIEPFLSNDYPYYVNISCRNSQNQSTEFRTIPYSNVSSPDMDNFVKVFGTSVVYEDMNPTTGNGWSTGIQATLTFDYAPSNGGEVDLGLFNINIVDSSTGDVIQSIVGGATSVYKISSLMNMSLGYGSSIQLKDNQSVSFFSDINGQELITKVVSNQTTPVTIMSNLNITTQLSKEVQPIYYEDYFGNEYSPIFYLFTDAQLVNSTVGSCNIQTDLMSNGNIRITVANTDQINSVSIVDVPVIIDYALPVGLFLNKVSLAFDTTTNLYIKNDGQYVYKFNTNDYNFVNAGIYYTDSFSEIISQKKQITISCDVKPNGVQEILISNLMLCNFNSTIDSVGKELILNKIKELDLSNMMDYMKAVRDDFAITNPLDGNQFIKDSHFYHDFSIPEAYLPEVYM